MECTARWTKSSSVILSETGSGHVVAIDSMPSDGGRNLAPRPMEVILAGTSGCTTYGVVRILLRNGQDVHACNVALKAERAETDPKVFTKIHFHFTVRGRNLKPQLVEHAIRLTHEKYCSASVMLEKAVELTHSFDIVDEAIDTATDTATAN